MKRFSRRLVDLASSTLVALAMAGIVFPPHIMASPVPEISDVIDHLRIDILEMSEGDTLPTRFKVSTSSAESFVFTSSGSEGFSWKNENDPAIAGFQALPNFDRVAKWRILQGRGGSFEADIPLSDFGAPSKDPAVRLSGAGKAGRVPEPRLTTFGLFNKEARSFEMSTVTPQGEVLDVTVSFAALSDDVEILGAGSNRESGQLSEKGIIIVISLSTLLIILGVALIACVAMFSACFIGCSILCPNGVKRVISAICGVGCTCECK
jgi:hypothetical protein